MPPRVSVNICCYNAERSLEATLRSVFAQTFTDWELVLVNDGSGDGTDAIVKRHVADGRPIVYINRENRGLSVSRNEAIERSSGELIAFLDHDDLWEPAKLASQVPLFDRDERVGIVYSDCVNFTEDGRSYRQFEKHQARRGFVFPDLLTDYFLNVQTVLVRRAAIVALPLWFDTRLTLVEEADLFLRLAYTWACDYVDAPLARWRLHASSTSSRLRDHFPDEMDQLLMNLAAQHPEAPTRYVDAWREFQRQIVRLRARIAWEQGRRREALHLLGPEWRGSWSAFRDFALFAMLSPSTRDRLRSWRRQ